MILFFWNSRIFEVTIFYHQIFLNTFLKTINPLKRPRGQNWHFLKVFVKILGANAKTTFYKL